MSRRRNTMQSCLFTGLCLVVGVVAPIAAQNVELGWQSSADTLAMEKQRAETCVSILKRHASANGSTLSRGQIAYSDAKAEADAAIAALTMALAQGREAPVSLPAIEEHLTKAGVQREEFCAYAVAQIPNAEGDSKQVMTDVLAEGVTALIGAAKDLFLNYRKETLMRREGISDEIEAKKWREFQDIPG
jgi:hypothetical protein